MKKRISTKKVLGVILIGALFTAGITASGSVYVQESENTPLSVVALENSQYRWKFLLLRM